MEKVQSVGLAVPYVNHRPKQNFIRRVIALPSTRSNTTPLELSYSWSLVRLLDPILN